MHFPSFFPALSRQPNKTEIMTNQNIQFIFFYFPAFYQQPNVTEKSWSIEYVVQITTIRLKKNRKNHLKKKKKTKEKEKMSDWIADLVSSELGTVHWELKLRI